MGVKIGPQRHAEHSPIIFFQSFCLALYLSCFTIQMAEGFLQQNQTKYSPWVSIMVYILASE